MKRFNYESESLKLVRDYYGMSQTAFAKEINLTQSKLSKIENGELELPEESVSNIEGFTKRFFEMSYSPTAQKLYYRKLASTSKSMVSKFEARLNLISNILKYLLEHVSIPENKLPSIDAEDFNLDFEYIAEEVRIALDIPRGPINDIVASLEKAGVIIHFFDYDFITEGNRKFDGVSTYVDGVPVILINNKIPNSRKVFTIAHELGHLVMHFDYIIHPDRDIECEANKFASAFLAPKAEVKKEFKSFNLDRLFYLKTEWKMSAAAILYRAKEIGNINDDWYRRCMVWLSNYRKREPYEFDIKTPSMLKRIIEVLKEKLDFSLLHTLGLKESVQSELLSTIYPKKERKLKISISNI
uniref:ImmA/IrrE family metallo-endopeptidase n=1 Tax=Ornithobacterium rhinotracheale TaxID=28251 RepID=UPI0039A461CC